MRLSKSLHSMGRDCAKMGAPQRAPLLEKRMNCERPCRSGLHMAQSLPEKR